MFFSAYVGTDEGRRRWREAAEAHAAWLGLTACVESHALAGGRCAGLAWLDPRPDPALRPAGRARAQIVTATVASDAGGRTDAPADPNAVRVDLSAAGDLRVLLPPTTPVHFYWARASQGVVLGDDLRLLLRLADPDPVPDARAVYALLQYGAPAAPLTVSSRVHRMPGGHVWRLAAGAEQPVLEPVDPTAEVRGDEEGDPASRVLRAVDASLSRVPADSVLYFSGGVDSGLLAARLRHLGRADVLLVNYGFGPRDEESRLAVRMAQHFGLRCEVVEHGLHRVPDMLARIAEDYSFPFGDLSTMPTNALVHASLGAPLPSMAIEGTGADTAFAMAVKYPQWDRVYRVPPVLRRQVARAYGWLDLWKSTSRAERLARFVRKSTEMPLGYAVLAQNALLRIAYDAPAEVRAAARRAVAESVEVVGAGLGTKERLCLLELVWMCPGRYAAKSFDPLRRRGVPTIYPFMDPALIGLTAALPWEAKSARGEAKSVLKELFVRHVPREWVYRRKSGFLPPYRELFADGAVQGVLHEHVLRPDNPLLEHCRPGGLAALVSRTRRGEPVNIGAYYFLWVLLFTSEWLRQQRSAGAALRAA